MDVTNNYGNSSFWMDRFSKFSDDSNLSRLEASNNNYYKLVAQKNAIANFVSIVTNQKIPVKFASSGDSYTDGQSVVISSKLNNPSEFDVAVGLALHEGSHIKLSDFKVIQYLANTIVRLPDYLDMFTVCESAGVDITSTVKDVLNWVEDRRIDNYIYSTSPGYRPYYKSLYDTYFNNSLIDKALQSDEFTDESFDSYMFRLINLHSDNTRLNALKGLSEISNIVDLPNIDRLQTTTDALEVAIDIFRVICKNVEIQQHQQQQSNQPNSENQNESESGDDSNDSNSGQKSKSKVDSKASKKSKEESESTGKSESTEESKADSKPSKKSKADSKSTEESKADSKSTEESKADSKSTEESEDLGDEKSKVEFESTEESNEPIELTPREKKSLEKIINQQKEFIRGELSKSKMSKNDLESINIIEKSNAELIEVGTEYTGTTYSKIKSVNCVLVKNMTMDLINSIEFPISVKTYSYNLNGNSIVAVDSCNEAVEAGIRMGTVLGKKMQIRSESRDTVFNRQLTGKLDKRMVASLGYGNVNAFYTKEVDVYNNVNLHISVDASYSMRGSKWNNTITNVVAIAKAVDMISNIEVQISFRSTDSSKNPYIVIAYDSRKDKFTKIKQLFKYLHPNGTTPEGLCFEAIQKYIIGSSNGLESFFLNISDGEPYYVNDAFVYSNKPAAEHIKKMMDGYRKMGIDILSYYVSDDKRTTNSVTARIFSESYGKSAKFIDVTSVNDVSNTINKLFMEKK